jgi:hypothetical protein
MRELPYQSMKTDGTWYFDFINALTKCPENNGLVEIVDCDFKQSLGW